MIKIEPIINTMYSSASYLCEEIILIDCGDWTHQYCEVKSVLLTHAHLDHIYGLNKLINERPDVLVYTNEYGKDMLLNAKKNLSYYHETPFVFSQPDAIKVVAEGQSIVLNHFLSAKAIFTPGHNPSCITWQIGDALFTGDSYIPGIKTVTNLPGGNKSQAAESEAMITSLAEGRTIYPGHKIE